MEGGAAVDEALPARCRSNVQPDRWQGCSLTEAVPANSLVVQGQSCVVAYLSGNASCHVSAAVAQGPSWARLSVLAAFSHVLRLGGGTWLARAQGSPQVVLLETKSPSNSVLGNARCCKGGQMAALERS